MHSKSEPSNRGPSYRELRALAKRLNADVYRLNRELRTLIETSNRTRDALFSVATERRGEEERARQESTCPAW